MANKKEYDEAFKADAVNYYINSGKGLSHAAKDLGIPYQTLDRWCKEADSGN